MEAISESNQLESLEHMISNIESYDSLNDFFDFNNLDEINKFATFDNDDTNILNSISTESNDSYAIQNSVSPINNQQQQQQHNQQYIFSNINELDTNLTNYSFDPISIVFTDPNNDQCKINSEIILNFDHIENENCLKQIEKQIENIKESFKIIVDKNNTIVELDKPDSNTDSESDTSDEMDYSTNIKKSILTEEEKNLFIKEGYQVPIRLPLTKNEEKLLKLIRRKIRNKKSAHISRERKKKYVDGLEQRVEMTTKENEQLHKQIKSLKNENLELGTKLKEMQKFLTEILNKNKKSSTVVLFVSFLITFCVYPYMNISEENISTVESSLRSVPFKGFSRALLSVASNFSESGKNDIYSNQSSYDDIVYSYYKDRYDF